MRHLLRLLILLSLTSGWAMAQNGGTNAVAGSALTTSSLGGTNLDQEARELKPRDVLRYTIEEDVNERGNFFPTVSITELGEAQFQISAGTQLYVQIKAAGRKLADIRKELKERLDAEYYQNATVSVDLNNTAPPLPGNPNSSSVPKVIIYGAINATVPLPEDRKKTLSEAFASLGGQNQYANLKNVEIFRIDPMTKQQVKFIKNVKDMLEKGDLREDMELMDGDRISVKERRVIGL